MLSMTFWQVVWSGSLGIRTVTIKASPVVP
jgi:hypothetical protein